MNNWINDARKHADTVKKQKQAASERLEQESRLVMQRQNGEIQKFYQEMMTRRVEIENVLSEARAQGLVVSDISAGRVPTNSLTGNFLYSSGLHDDIWVEDDPATSFAMYWEITEPNSGKKTIICLGANCSENWLLGSVMKPSITAQQVESIIKNWLVQIFS